MDTPNWHELNGLSEDAAEDYMLENWGGIPDAWNNPLFRDEVTGISGQAELDAHLNFGEQAYGSDSRLGDAARPVWHRRNIDGQGHPAENSWLSRLKGRRK